MYKNICGSMCIFCWIIFIPSSMYDKLYVKLFFCCSPKFIKLLEAKRKRKGMIAIMICYLCTKGPGIIFRMGCTKQNNALDTFIYISCAFWWAKYFLIIWRVRYKYFERKSISTINQYKYGIVLFTDILRQVNLYIFNHFIFA